MRKTTKKLVALGLAATMSVGSLAGCSSSSSKDSSSAMLGPDKIIGVSAQTVEQAELAEKRGADYLGVGAVFKTGSKADADDVSFETLKAICSAVSIPVIAIGGITHENVKELSGSGICGIAVISAIYAADDIKKAAEDLKAETIRSLKIKI